MSTLRAQAGSDALPTFLPGTLRLGRGTMADYWALAPFHYVAGRPATIAGIWTIAYADPSAQPSARLARPVAVGVLSWPTPSFRPRERHFGRAGLGRYEKARWVNENLRTISRVIVHPQFRSVGLARALVERICDDCATRYVEAIAQMGIACPFFQQAGMSLINPDRPEAEPAYFLKQLRIDAPAPTP